MPITVHEPTRARRPLTTITAPSENSIKISRAGVEPGVVPPHTVRAGADGPFVLLVVNDKAGHLRTRQAQEAGIAILAAKRDCAPYESVCIEVNGERFVLLPTQAHKLATGLIKGSDRVDEIQLNQRVRIRE